MGFSAFSDSSAYPHRLNLKTPENGSVAKSISESCISRFQDKIFLRQVLSLFSQRKINSKYRDCELIQLKMC